MKISLNLLLFLCISVSLTTAEENILNQIENDHRIRNFAFLGPFSSSFNTDSLINELDLQSFSLNKNVNANVF